MHFLTIAIGALASLLAVQAAIIPIGAKDGMYIHTVDPETGEQLATRVPDFDIPAPEAPEKRGALAKRKDGLTCDYGPASVSAQDYSNAVNKFRSWTTEGGRSWSNSVSFVSGNAVAYACSYGGSQKTTRLQVDTYFGRIWGCGANAAGWFAIESWNVSYGRTKQGVGFC